VLAFALAPATSFAVTMQEIVALSKAGVSDAVILALIERDKTIYALNADQLIALKHEGVSEPVVLAMLRSGRQEPPPPPLTPVVEAPIPEPYVVVPQNPDRPSAPEPPPPAPPAYPVPVLVPYFVPAPIGVASGCVTRVITPPPVAGQFFNDNGARGTFFSNPPPAPTIGAPAGQRVVTDCAPRGVSAGAHHHR